jgi:hypothetical protein
MIAQSQRQQNAQNGNRRMGYNPPATAGPMTTSFNVPAVETAPRRMHSNQLRNLALPAEDQVPMTAALGGKFGGRLAGRLSEDDEVPGTPTRVISGGAVLGQMTATPTTDKSKADGSSSWRRGPVGTPIARTVSPSVRITPPPGERVSPPPTAISAAPKTRPSRLSFNLQAAQSHTQVAAVVDNSDATATTEEEFTSSGSSGSEHSSPVTSEESSHSYSRPPLSPREEASKKLYEGLGIGRPASESSASVETPVAAPVQRIVSQAMRMPRGPPSGADELGPKNFATRIRRKAVGGLSVLLDARERREVEAF